ncbi:MAG: FAD/NAD(P)-binding protein [Actinomycetia bacterium]|nr:FAD/NAD(P)-binding protein [Actinomycetes bacterium]
MSNLTRNAFIPNQARIIKIKAEAENISTFTLSFRDKNVQDHYTFEPGQYNMLSLPGIGEAAISISSSPHQRDALDHTIRLAGRVTTAVSNLKVGDTIGVRGPYGRPWPVKELEDKDVAVIVGGTGCACVKPAINILTDHMTDYKSATVLYGSKVAQELLFADEYSYWQDQGVNLHLTVDEGRSLDWPFHVGVVATLFDELKEASPDSRALISGPDIMMRFCVIDLLKRGWSRKNIFLSLERRMDCAIKMCGHCQLGPVYVCQDGPVFCYEEIEDVFGAVA